MGYEYDAIANDVDDYRRRRDVSLQLVEALVTLACKYGSASACNTRLNTIDRA